MPDYYETLGVDRTASSDDIKKAYRRLAHKYHPDKAGGDEEKFKEVNEAYQVLGNEQKRNQYDRFGQAFEGEPGPFGRGGFSGQGFNFNFEDLGGISDIFDTFFSGGQTTRTRRRRGNDVQIDVEIAFADSAKGKEQAVNHRLYQVCSKCNGNGVEPGTPIEECKQCGGRGLISQTRRTPFGVFTTQSECPACRGEGKQAKTVCSRCRGEGRELKDRMLTFDIPAGIRDNQTIRLSGKGEAPPRGGETGDLYVTVHVQPDPSGMTRDGDNVRSAVSIPFIEAALGIVISLPTLAGAKELQIPAGTQPGSEIRMAGAGFPQLGGARRGDHIVTVQVEVPRRLSRKQRRLLEEFKSAGRRGFFS